MELQQYNIQQIYFRLRALDQRHNMASEENKVKLYGMWASPFSKRVEIALKMKGVEYEYNEEDLFSNKSQDLLKYNPVYKKVPVLVHNGKLISESLMIIEYIDETWKSGPALLPAEAYERAMARFWADFGYTKCILPIWAANWTSDEEKSKKLAEEACENLRTLEKQLGNNKFFGGENVGYLDIAALFLAHWVGAVQKATGKEVVKDVDFPQLSKWKEEFLKCSIVKETLPHNDKLAAFFEDKASFYKAYLKYPTK